MKETNTLKIYRYVVKTVHMLFMIEIKQIKKENSQKSTPEIPGCMYKSGNKL